ncbi:hematopoietic prostaglandin D synthase-like [Branchiostoma floridae]|uniref:glutathione transferase n=1 Tax=Branchiostoma floridae TaxID=7739 RepID=A0A9J7KJ74_BRAFL|nr:hematopoietic prostaglandin D synthase-like [Branchiostoma floridae]
MPSYKLTYFKHWGRAGVLRLLFAAGGIEFEDVRIDRETQWPDFKPTTPMGQLPILEVDGTIICQKRAIGRMIAKKAGLAGKTPLEEARIDMIVDGLADMETIFAGLYREKDEKTKLENMKKFAGETLPMFLNNFEKLASSSGHFVGDVLTWADVDFFAMVFFAKDHLPYDPLTGYANLTKVIDNVTSNPRIAEWMKKEAAQ